MHRPSNPARLPSTRSAASTPRPVGGFTLVELLVVIGLIVILIGILIPSIHKMRVAGYEADTRSLLNQIEQACQVYFADNKAYPGPIADADLVPVSGNQPAFAYGTPSGGSFGTAKQLNPAGQRITASENLLIGLLGGFEQGRASGAPAFYFDPATVGTGPSQLGATARSRGKSYIDGGLRYASKGRLRDVFANPMADTIVPEFLDAFPGGGEVSDVAADGSLQSRPGGMPILYLRSRKRADLSVANKPLVSANPADVDVNYQLLDVIPYTYSSVGGGRDSGGSLAPKYVGVTYSDALPHGLISADPAKTIYRNNPNSGVTFQYPFDAYDYLTEPSSYDRTKATLTAAEQAAKRSRKPDSYILISAGRDRIFGTEDDITNFGSVTP